MYMKKKLIIIITSVFLIICTIGVITISMLPDLPQNPSKEKLINFYHKNRNTFEEVVEYLRGIEGDIFLSKSDGRDINSIGKIDTKDGIKPFSIGIQAKDNIYKLLFKYGFQHVYEQGNCIYFVKFAGFQWHKSLIYSKDGKAPPLNRKRDFAELGEGWFYYEGE